MTNSFNRLQGKTAIVTGAASGIGEAITQLFSIEGASVLAIDTPNSKIKTAYLNHSRVTAMALDVTDENAPSQAIQAVIGMGSGLDILVNNAGITRFSLAESTSDEEWDRVFEVNTQAVFRFCREAIPALKHSGQEAGHARIINVASILADKTETGQAAYAASKHAVAGLTKTLALELGRFGITANYLMPGAIHTGMTSQVFDDAEVRQVWEKKTAMRRLGISQDIANAALFLASDEASFITGHGLVVDGGLTLRI